MIIRWSNNKSRNNDNYRCLTSRYLTALRIVLFFLLAVLTTSTAIAKPLKILSTIKPISLLVNEIVGQHASSELLIPHTMNVHDYSFRPTDLRKLARADVVIRISEHMETFLNTFLDASIKQSNKHIVSLSDTPQLHWLATRGEHAHHAESHTDSPLHTDSDSHYEYDYHIWLDPHNALLLVNYITQQLSAIDTAHAQAYQANSESLKHRIRATSQLSRQQLQTVQQRPYLVFHDAWHYLENAYGLMAPHVITRHDELPPGIKTMLKLRQQLKSDEIRCIIASPNSNKRLIHTLTGNLPMQTAWLSPVAINTSINSYPAFMQYTVAQFTRCLKH